MSLVVFVSDDGGVAANVARASFTRMAPEGWCAEAAVIGARRAASMLTRRLTPELEVRADLLVTIGTEARCVYAVGEVEAWPAPESSLTRLAIETRVRELVGSRLAAIPCDRTAHQRRLAVALPALARDFGATRSAQEIRACAEAVLSPVEDSGLARFADEGARALMLAAADRETRACLEERTCACSCRSGRRCATQNR